MEIKVYEKGKRDKDFYGWIGPFALNRTVSDEIHDRKYESVYDEPDRATWFIGLDGDELVGFCAIYESQNQVYLDNSYILPEFRGNGYGKELFAFRLEFALEIAAGRPIKGITMSPKQYKIYLQNGFVETSKRGRYWWMRRDTK